MIGVTSRDQENRKSSCPLLRHDMKHHHGVQQKYMTNIVASEKKIVKLSCLEAVHIEKHPNHILLNEKNEKEWRAKPLQLI